MSTYELTHQETKEIRYTTGDSAEMAIKKIIQCALPNQITAKVHDSPYNPWDYPELISAREMSNDEVKSLDPSKIEEP